MNTMDQIARDIREGAFPQKSEKTLREEAMMRAVSESLAVGAPGIAEQIRQGIARSIVMKVGRIAGPGCDWEMSGHREGECSRCGQKWAEHQKPDGCFNPRR